MVIGLLYCASLSDSLLLFTGALLQTALTAALTVVALPVPSGRPSAEWIGFTGLLIFFGLWLISGYLLIEAYNPIMIKNLYTLLLLLATFATSALAQDKITIQDGDLVAGGTYNWTADNCYLLDGLVFLEEGGVLNIEPGTVIQGAASPTTGDNTSALIITRDAQIFANGTATEPIILTAENPDGCEPPELTKIDRGQWGGWSGHPR